MQKLINLILWELKIQHKVNNLTKYLFIFCLFSALSTAMLNKHEDINKFGALFSIIYIPLSFTAFANILFKQDIEDGSLESLLSNFSASQIVIAKMISVFLCAFIGCVMNLPIIYIIFDLTLDFVINLAILLTLLLLLTSSLIVLIGAIQGYFRSNTNFISVLIMPLIIPAITISGLALQDATHYYLTFIMIGINLILLPCSILLSSYLIQNIYNV